MQDATPHKKRRRTWLFPPSKRKLRLNRWRGGGGGRGDNLEAGAAALALSRPHKRGNARTRRSPTTGCDNKTHHAGSSSSRFSSLTYGLTKNYTLGFLLNPQQSCLNARHFLRNVHKLVSTEVVAVQVLQALAFFLCYACTRSVCSRRFWAPADVVVVAGAGDEDGYKKNTSSTSSTSNNLLATHKEYLHFGIVGITFFMPNVLPVAYLIMAMPPYFDKENQTVFTQVLEDFPYGFGGDFYLHNPKHWAVRGKFKKASFGVAVSLLGKHPNLVYKRTHVLVERRREKSCGEEEKGQGGGGAGGGSSSCGEQDQVAVNVFNPHQGSSVRESTCDSWAAPQATSSQHTKSHEEGRCLREPDLGEDEEVGTNNHPHGRAGGSSCDHSTERRQHHMSSFFRRLAAVSGRFHLPTRRYPGTTRIFRGLSTFRRPHFLRSFGRGTSKRRVESLYSCGMSSVGGAEEESIACPAMVSRQILAELEQMKNRTTHRHNNFFQSQPTVSASSGASRGKMNSDGRRRNGKIYNSVQSKNPDKDADPAQRNNYPTASTPTVGPSGSKRPRRPSFPYVRSTFVHSFRMPSVTEEVLAGGCEREREHDEQRQQQGEQGEGEQAPDQPEDVHLHGRKQSQATTESTGIWIRVGTEFGLLPSLGATDELSASGDDSLSASNTTLGAGAGSLPATTTGATTEKKAEASRTRSNKLASRGQSSSSIDSAVSNQTSTVDGPSCTVGSGNPWSKMEDSGCVPSSSPDRGNVGVAPEYGKAAGTVGSVVLVRDRGKEKAGAVALPVAGKEVGSNDRAAEDEDVSDADSSLDVIVDGTSRRLFSFTRENALESAASSNEEV